MNYDVASLASVALGIATLILAILTTVLTKRTVLSADLEDLLRTLYLAQQTNLLTQQELASIIESAASGKTESYLRLTRLILARSEKENSRHFVDLDLALKRASEKENRQLLLALEQYVQQELLAQRAMRDVEKSLVDKGAAAV